MNHNLTGIKPIQKSSVDEIAAAILYEGYILYPYRASAVKNRHRFNFGTLAPQIYHQQVNESEPCQLRTQCLLQGVAPQIRLRVRFLQPIARQVCKLKEPVNEIALDSLPDFELVPSMEVNGEILQTWQEVIEREIVVDWAGLNEDLVEQQFSFAATESFESIRASDGRIVALVRRTQREVTGRIEIECQRLEADLHRLTLIVRNETQIEKDVAIDREQLMLASLASAHAIIETQGGKFISLLEPPTELAAAADGCSQTGCWPVLVGEPGDRSTMLASPIILYDYPQIAAESDGDFFDGCEIDEMLALRVMTLTDSEKQEMRGVDSRARQILERTDSSPEDYLMKLHGRMQKGNS